MNHRNIITLDFTGCRTYFDFHECIRRTFDFPEWYGRNWDAFYDLMCTDVESCHVIIKGICTLPAELHEVIPKMIEVLEAIKADRLKLNDILTYELIS